MPAPALTPGKRERGAHQQQAVTVTRVIHCNAAPSARHKEQSWPSYAMYPVSANTTAPPEAGARSRQLPRRSARRWIPSRPRSR
ncbi:hypothetical protein CBM2586_B130622 [Cupriavidus phytorum]|uniref:Uncharacterized protein n=1 Tax=Cupriavidus taiwanensis TaxID=164546 RepID=A0A975XLI5_9BURK|nr:hypothetical protein CBM2586_B130622 [Cupriavidus taiwanensis]